MTVKCVEPAAASPGGDRYLVSVAADDELLFPHVDSCIAIAFLLGDGRMIGGHVGMMMPGATDLNPHGNALQICNEMIAKVGASQVKKVIMVGDANWENDFITGKNVVKDIVKTAGCGDSLFIDTGAYGGGVDVSLNPRRSMVFVQRCTADRAVVFQRPYKEITGNETKRLG